MSTMKSLKRHSSCSSSHRGLRAYAVTRVQHNRDLRAYAVSCLGAVLAVFLSSATASAQNLLSDRVSVEFASAITSSSPEPTDPFVVLDATATVRITGTLDVIVRPWFRRLPGGDWSKEMYQLQVRYQPSTRIPLRVDAGIISSPLGIIALEMRPDRNPIIGTPSYYFSPLPSFDGRFDRVQLLSGGYPLGAMVSTSGLRWDARAGVTDGTPARNRKMMSTNRPPAEPQFVAGGGVNPVAGLRLGAGYAHGLYRTQTASSLPIPATQSATRDGLQPRGRVRDRLHADRRRVDHGQLRNGHESRHRTRLPDRSRPHALATLVHRRTQHTRVDAGVRRRHARAPDQRHH